jgi:hypothetical protein
MARRILKLCTLLPPSAADPSLIPADPEEDRGAINTIRRWPNGSVLRVFFTEGEPAVKKRVIPIAQEWSQYANIKLEFVDDPNAEIRIAFNPRAGSWSYMGNDCLLPVLRGKPTMNLGWLKPNTAEKEYRRVVLHEFGHALGLIHEHLSPGATIPWDAQKVIEYYRRTNGWDEAYTRSNVLTPMPADEYTRFDPQSIMLYPVPKELTIGGFEIPWSNTELSESDRSFIAKIYPFPKK